MSDIILQVTDEKMPAEKPQDGDILCAFTDQRILTAHADTICDVRKAGLDRNGYRPDGLARRYLDLKSKWRFQRVSRTEMSRTDLASGGVDILDLGKIGNMPRLDIYLRRRLAHKAHRIFSVDGLPTWHGGSRNPSEYVSGAWDAIEELLRIDRRDYCRWPFTHAERRRWLVMRIDEMPDEIASRMEAIEVDYGLAHPQFDPSSDRRSVVTQARRFNVPWRQMGLDVKKVLDRREELDLRDSVCCELSSVSVKKRIVLWR